jgi:hypothetical protein
MPYDDYEEGLVYADRYQDKEYRDKLTAAGVRNWNEQGGRYAPMEDSPLWQRMRGGSAPTDIAAIEEQVNRQTAEDKYSGMRGGFYDYQKTIDPEKHFQRAEGNENVYLYNGLPVRQASDGAWYYDASMMAQMSGYDEATAGKLANDDWITGTGDYKLPAGMGFYNEGLLGGSSGQDYGIMNKALPGIARGMKDKEAFGSSFMDDQGIFLRNLARTPVVLDSGLNLADERHMQNIYQGNTTVDAVGQNGNWNTGRYNKQLYYKPDEQHWYSPSRLIPALTLGAMGAMAGGIGGVLMAPVGAGIGGGGMGGAAALGLAPGSFGSGLATGAVVGGASAVPSALHTGAKTGDWGAAAKQVGMGAAGGAVMGGAGNLIGKGMDALTAADTGYVEMPTGGVMGGEESNIFGSPRPFTDPSGGVGSGWDLTQGIDYAGSLEALGDMYGGLDSGYYGLTMPTQGAGSMFDPTQNQGLGGVMRPEEMQRMTDNLEFLGENPGVGAANYKGMDWKNQAMKLLDLYGPDGPPSDGMTGFQNSDFTPRWEPQDNLPPMTSGMQAGGAGYQFGGSNVTQDISQQFGAVRPSGLENYSQDLMAMVQESPDMLENPMIMNMIQDQLMGGGPFRKPMGLEDPLNTAGMVV